MRNLICQAWLKAIGTLLPLAAAWVDPVSGSPIAHPVEDPGSKTEIYARATNSFASALLFKPAEGTGDDLTFRLAPWIFQEVPEQAQLPEFPPDQFGFFAQTNGVWSVDPSRPTVYTLLDTVALKGKTHARLTCLWCYPTAPGGANSLAMQGIRLTLNQAGDPAIWEVLEDETKAALLFVSQSLESAAQAQFGRPLPGRRFAIEASQGRSPRTIVARVIEDGPIPMGPLVYLRAGSRSIGTLTCRCMPAQAKRLVRTQVYERLPLSPAIEAIFTSLRSNAGNQCCFWPEDGPHGSRLEHALRFPDSF